MSAGVTVRGADTLARTARNAARQLENMAAANARVASMVASAATPPVRTGRLRGSVSTSSDATTATVSWPVPYAGIVDHRTRFASRALEARTPAAINTYAGAVNDAVAGVRGV